MLNSEAPSPEGNSNPVMINFYLLTSTIRSDAPVAFMLLGEVRPSARKFGGVTAGGRAP
jgi:hypothetical protein